VGALLTERRGVPFVVMSEHSFFPPALYPLYVLPSPSLAIRAKSSKKIFGFIYITGGREASSA
jgi:hypothetical protein